MEVISIHDIEENYRLVDFAVTAGQRMKIK